MKPSVAAAAFGEDARRFVTRLPKAWKAHYLYGSGLKKGERGGWTAHCAIALDAFPYKPSPNKPDRRAGERLSKALFGWIEKAGGWSDGEGIYHGGAVWAASCEYEHGKARGEFAAWIAHGPGKRATLTAHLTEWP